jgi:hypothetical protein
MHRDATISDCGRFRYLLSRTWNADLPPLLFVMLNPSTADALEDDATIRRCVNFARAEGRFGGIEVVNLFAFRATDPADLRRAGWPVGPDNDAHIVAAALRASAVCVAWGAVKEAEERVQVVMPNIRAAGHAPQCLHVTRSGFPGHPLYLASSKRLQPFDAAVEAALEAGHA